MNVLAQGEKATAEAQAQAVRNVGRGMNGTALLALFGALAAKGLIDVAGADDKDKEALEKAQRRNGTQWNLTATQRWMNGESTEWRDGDTLLSIGFLEPINAAMAAGALLSEAYEEDGTMTMGKVANASASATIQAVLDLPALTSISDMVNAYTYADGETTAEKAQGAVVSYAGSQASSLVPNAVRGIAQGMDNTARNQYTAGTPIGEMADSIKAGIPGLRRSLPASLDGFGRERTYTDDPVSNFLNSNLLPGQITPHRRTELEDELERLYRETEDAGVYPNRKAPNSVTVNSVKIPLNAGEKEQYQRIMGGTALDLGTRLIGSDEYKGMDDAQKAQAIREVYDLAKQTAKEAVSDYMADSWIAKAERAEADYGIPKETYISLKVQTAGITSLKDANGDTITNSKGLQIMEVVYDTPGLSDKQRKALFEALGAGKTIQNFTKAQVKQKLKEMRAK